MSEETKEPATSGRIEIGVLDGELWKKIMDGIPSVPKNCTRLVFDTGYPEGVASIYWEAFASPPDVQMCVTLMLAQVKLNQDGRALPPEAVKPL